MSDRREREPNKKKGGFAGGVRGGGRGEARRDAQWSGLAAEGSVLGVLAHQKNAGGGLPALQVGNDF